MPRVCDNVSLDCLEYEERFYTRNIPSIFHTSQNNHYAWAFSQQSRAILQLPGSEGSGFSEGPIWGSLPGARDKVRYGEPFSMCARQGAQTWG